MFHLILAVSLSLVSASSGAHTICGDCHVDGRFVGAEGRCVNCHEAAQAASPVGHACIDCHSPHPNGREAMLAVNVDPGEGPVAPRGFEIDSISMACAGCHQATLEFGRRSGHFVRHPVGLIPSSYAQGAIELPRFDVAGTADPDDDVIGCLTCHQVHDPGGSPTFMLRWTFEQQQQACTSCHTEVLRTAL